MKRIRKGNDIQVQWSVFSEEKRDYIPYDLTGKNLTFLVKNQFETKQVKDFSLSGNVLSWTFLGKDQQRAGLYTLELIENNGKEGMHTVDVCDAFQLVHNSCEAGGKDEEAIELVNLKLTSSVGVVGANTGGTGLKYSEERTVYLTEIHEDGDYTLGITEEEREYNIETVNKVFEGVMAGVQKVFIALYGRFYFILETSGSNDKKSATFSDVIEYEGSLQSIKVTITSEGDAIAEATNIKTGGSAISDFNNDFNNDF